MWNSFYFFSKSQLQSLGVCLLTCFSRNCDNYTFELYTERLTIKRILSLLSLSLLPHHTPTYRWKKRRVGLLFEFLWLHKVDYLSCIVSSRLTLTMHSFVRAIRAVNHPIAQLRQMDTHTSSRTSNVIQGALDLHLLGTYRWEERKVCVLGLFFWVQQLIVWIRKPSCRQHYEITALTSKASRLPMWTETHLKRYQAYEISYSFKIIP